MESNSGFGRSESAEVGGHLLGRKGLEDVAFLDVAEPVDADAALHAVRHFAGVVLEALERADLALEDLFATAHDFDFRIATDNSILHAAAGDGAHLGNTEDVDDFRTAHVVLL